EPGAARTRSRDLISAACLLVVVATDVAAGQVSLMFGPRFHRGPCPSNSDHPMSDEPKTLGDADKELERELRADRKFSLSEALGRMAGPGMMKGVSPVPPKQQAEAAIEGYVNEYLPDAAGTLRGILIRDVKECDLLLDNFDCPLAALGSYVRRVL